MSYEVKSEKSDRPPRPRRLPRDSRRPPVFKLRRFAEYACKSIFASAENTNST